MAVDCERLRSALFDWMRNTLFLLYRAQIDDDVAMASITQSKVGLWVTHKAEFLFPDIEKTGLLQQQLEVIDNYAQKGLMEQVRESNDDVKDAVTNLNDAVNHAAAIISGLVEQALAGERARDPLTHVLSRRYLDTIMQREIRLSIQSGQPFAVMLMNIDSLKQLKDNYGHVVGNKVLEIVADVLRHSVRASDFVFRYGGEEFLVLLSNSSKRSALYAAEKIRTSVEECRIDTDQGSQVSVTVSIGLALHHGYPDYNHVINLADVALYEAKSAGRNKCIAA